MCDFRLPLPLNVSQFTERTLIHIPWFLFAWPRLKFKLCTDIFRLERKSSTMLRQIDWFFENLFSPLWICNYFYAYLWNIFQNPFGELQLRRFLSLIWKLSENSLPSPGTDRSFSELYSYCETRKIKAENCYSFMPHNIQSIGSEYCDARYVFILQKSWRCWRTVFAHFYVCIQLHLAHSKSIFYWINVRNNTAHTHNICKHIY